VAEDQGSNTAALFCETRGGLEAAVGLDGAVDGADRLKAELRLDDGTGEETLVGGGTGGGAGDANPAKSSSANKSWEAEALGFEVVVDGRVKPKSRPLDSCRGGRA
jgi:hypothetical protein